VAFGDLTTLGDVKAWLQTGANAFPAADDALLSRLITAASQFIQTWLNRRLAQSDWIEIRDGTGGRRLPFANFPVSAVLSLTVDGLVIPPAPLDGGFGAGYVFTPTELALRGYIFTARVQNVVVSYTAGYVVTPPEVAQACIELVAQRYKERGRIGEMSKSLGGGETVTFSQQDMSADIKTLLGRYRAVAPVLGFAAIPAPTATDPAMVVGLL
jgi:Phage gp6-like head-tail connector protein